MPGSQACRSGSASRPFFSDASAFAGSSAFAALRRAFGADPTPFLGLPRLPFRRGGFLLLRDRPLGGGGPLAGALDQPVAHLLRVPGGPVDLPRVLAQLLDPRVDVGGVAGGVVPDVEPVAGHQRADLGPELLAGVGVRAEAVLDALEQRLVGSAGTGAPSSAPARAAPTGSSSARTGTARATAAPRSRAAGRSRRGRPARAR